ncbi:MAG: hypothetical protein VXX85_08030, partial [Candidatus Margulisiibacteriota bacterium]|nr:hypothetical protein [Candidatus Margulisiibacteriota bacterium]
MSSLVNQFKSILKKKGTGKTMSKHMDESDINFVLNNMISVDIPLTTRSTLLTAWIMLDKTDIEQNAFNYLLTNKIELLPKELWFLIDKTDLKTDQIIHRAMEGNATSKQTINHLFDQYFANQIPDFKLASFLEGLRLKEETFEENTAIFDYFRRKTTQVELDIPILIDIATPYDGFNRSYFLQPFVCALLASVGIPSILHGVKEVSPKKGISTHKLLLEANKNPELTLDEVKNQIMDQNIGWVYVDQSQFCPQLYKLNQLRVDMVKRPVLATIEKWLQPIKANSTVCLTGFTHPPYKQKTIDIIDYANCYESLILVRGVEGSTLLPPDRRTPYITMVQNKSPNFLFMSPNDHDFDEHPIENQNPNNSLTAGINALTGKNNQLTDYI